MRGDIKSKRCVLRARGAFNSERCVLWGCVCEGQEVFLRARQQICVLEEQYVCFSEELACTRRNVCILKSLCVSGQYVIYTLSIDDFLWVLRAVGVFLAVTHIF